VVVSLCHRGRCSLLTGFRWFQQYGCGLKFDESVKTEEFSSGIFSVPAEHVGAEGLFPNENTAEVVAGVAEELPAKLNPGEEFPKSNPTVVDVVGLFSKVNPENGVIVAETLSNKEFSDKLFFPNLSFFVSLFSSLSSVSKERDSSLV